MERRYCFSRWLHFDCGHTEQLPGERFTIYLSDGREAEALALGSNPISDIGLVKITTQDHGHLPR